MLVLFLSSGCVTQKKHKETVASYERALMVVIDSLDQQMAIAATLDSSLIFSEGTSAGLLSAQERLQDDLQKQALLIRELQNSASATQSTLQSDLQQLRRDKDQLDNRYQAMQRGYADILATYNEQAEQIVTELVAELDTILSGQGSIQLRFRPGSANLVIPEGYLFRSGSSSRLSADHELILSAVARVIEDQPLLKLRIEGHTDSEEGRIDNWSFAAARTARITRILVDEFYLSPSRLSAVSYGEYAPLSSNATPGGRAKNRRIEFVFYRDLTNLSRAFQNLNSEINDPD
ncbi:MAG: OmpA family protein [Bacteroidota bacterium]